MRFVLLAFTLILLTASIQGKPKNKYWHKDAPVPELPREKYVCYRTSDSINIDGIPDENSWTKAEWSGEFVDIRGAGFPTPAYATRVKMLWDDNYFYVAARLEEPHIQGTITRHDAVIFRDNDFEVFIDPSGDTHLYYELEINALNTIWDLLLVKPYRVGGPPINSLESPGIKTAVHINGTLNHPEDKDSCWYVEMAIPLATLAELDGKKKPTEGTQWRVNFSRVQWHTRVVDGVYEKITDPETGTPLPEENWVWSPQGVIDMHRPETWGYVQFSESESGAGSSKFENRLEEETKWALRNIFLAQRKYHGLHGHFADSLNQLREVGFNTDALNESYEIRTGWHTFEIKSSLSNSDWFINQEGRVWSAKMNN